MSEKTIKELENIRESLKDSQARYWSLFAPQDDPTPTVIPTHKEREEAEKEFNRLWSRLK